MEKREYQFEDLLADVHPDYMAFAKDTHESLVRDGYKFKIEAKKSGYTATYAHPKTKRSLLNFLIRKKGLFVRVYIDNVQQYADFLNALPEEMEKEIAKASVCKRLLNPEDCNPRCVKGYDFIIKGNHYQKCRYSCFQFLVNTQSVPFISDFVERERRERAS